MKYLLTTMSVAVMGLSSMTQVVAQETNYPDQAIRIVVPFPPGGTTDTLIRLIGPELAKKMGQPIVVENKPGAATTVGAQFVARAKPDGYTLFAASLHQTIAQVVFPNLKYHIGKDLTSIGTMAMVPNVVVVNSNMGVNTIDELVAKTKKDPNQYNYGSAGPGSAHHLIGEMFKLKTGASLTHVPYGGSAPAVLGLLSGQVSVMFDTATSALPNIKSGKTKALAVTTSQRSSALPDVATLEELGIKDFDVGTWFGLMAPAGTDAKILAKLNKSVDEIVNDTAFQKKLTDQGIEPMSGTADAMSRRIDNEVKQFGELVKQINLKVE